MATSSLLYPHVNVADLGQMKKLLIEVLIDRKSVVYLHSIRVLQKDLKGTLDLQNYSIQKTMLHHHRTTEYLKRNLFNNQSSHQDVIKDTKTAITEVFKHAYYIKEERGQQKDVGSTAVLLGDRLFVANVE
ncbi:putative protein phosphatase 2C 11, partial [Cucurbita argyrosperma subsp. sororia]